MLRNNLPTRSQVIVGAHTYLEERNVDLLHEEWDLWNMLAFDGRLYQLLALSVHERPAPPPASRPRRGPGHPEPISAVLTPLLQRLQASSGGAKRRR